MQVCTELGRTVCLRRLLPEASISGGEDVWIGGCTSDSRRVRPGDLFAALQGSRCDGHDFAAEAIGRGCAAVLSDRAMPELPVPTCVVPDARAAFARLCQALAGSPGRQLELIGVAGAYGKTTTSCLVAGVLAAADNRIGVVGTLGYLDGRTVEQGSQGTPSPERLALLLARMVRNGCTHTVMEVSNHALQQSRVAGLEFDAACLTNIAQDHLDHNATPADHHRAQSKIFDYLGVEGLAVFNADDPDSAAVLRRHTGPTLTVAIRSEADITAVPVEQFAGEQTFLLVAGSETVPVRTRMIGEHHIYNCLEAAAVGLAYDIELTTIVRGLESAGQIPGRLERIECGQPFGVFVDFARTPVALAVAMKTLRDVTPGRLICVFGADGQCDARDRPRMGRAVERAADVAIVTNDNPRHEDPLAICRDVLSGFIHRAAARVILDRVAAIHHALSLAEPGDCVLVTGKGHETCQIMGDERISLDDREVAREWLYRGEGLGIRTPRSRE
jgi:UDP-N-acetylmuramoyl-L-alanyl-D-glutamate--2,6-diaminopimelate ligase